MKFCFLLAGLLSASTALAEPLGDAGMPEGVPLVDAGTPEAVDAGAPVLTLTPPPMQPPKPVVVPPPAPVAKQQPVAKAEPPPEEPSSPAFDIDWSILLPPHSPLEKQFYELSAVYAVRNFGFAEGPMKLTGLRVNERNGGVGKMMVYILSQLVLALGEAAATSQGKYLGSTYGPGYRIDYSRAYTSSELADMRQARESAGDDVLASNFSLDLSYYFPVPGISTTAGFSIELTPLTIAFDDKQQWGMEVAFVWSRFGDKNVGAGPTMGNANLADRQYNNLGVPIRFMHQGRFVHVTLQWTPNIFGGFGVSPKVMEANYTKSFTDSSNVIAYNNSPLMLAISFTPVRHVFVRATGYWEKYSFSTSALSYQLEAGLRF